MKKHISSILSIAFMLFQASAQKIIPLDTLHWKIEAESYVIEPYKGKEAIYFKQGAISLKDVEFRNGIIEYDIFLKDARGFPGIYFRVNGQNSEEFYVRPHQSGNPDANQVQPVTNGMANWQFYFGPKYSFPYNYNFKDWTHVKILVNEDRAQVFLDNSEKPQLSWKLFHKPTKGGITLSGGLDEAIHLADIKVTHGEFSMENFEPGVREPIDDLIPQWEISDKFEESDLEGVTDFANLIGKRSWKGKINVEEGTAANISRLITLDSEIKGNTVFAKIKLRSEREQLKLFEFGYSDRVVVILNGKPIYKGTNRFRSRDYRYLGTIGIFDAVFLPLQKGENTIILAVSEDFGGWLVTGKFTDNEGLKL